MDSRERFFATINYEKTDRPASWLGLPVPAAEKNLFAHFGVSSITSLKQTIDDDIWPIEVPFDCPPANHIACAFQFAKLKHNDTPDERTLTAPGFFEDFDDPRDVVRFNWPDPSGMIRKEESQFLAKAIPADKIRMGVMWSAHFQDACAAFGMEHALMTMLMNPGMFQTVIDRITEFYLMANEIFYEATKGYLDAVLIGNDFGSQTGLMVDPESLRQFVFPGTKKIIDQARSYGLKVIHHSCGSIFPIIGDLASLGADVVHPVQALAANMDPRGLKAKFEGKVAFCGGIDAQFLLVKQRPEEVRAKVRELMEIFPTGLILSPSHEAILPDIPPANIEAIFAAIRESEN